jgi:hypothetical protein
MANDVATPSNPPISLVEKGRASRIIT